MWYSIHNNYYLCWQSLFNAYCFMSSHARPEHGRRVHLVFRSSKGDPFRLLRDFKVYTAKKDKSHCREPAGKQKRMALIDACPERSRRV